MFSESKLKPNPDTSFLLSFWNLDLNLSEFFKS